MFISFLTGKDERRMDVIRALLQREQRGLIQIVISTFVTVEVRPDEGNPLDQGQLAMIAELFESDRLDYRPLTPHIAKIAQKIGMDFPTLTPPDCVHIATAIESGASVLFTFDGSGAKRRRPSEMIINSGKIGNPTLKICEPFIDHGPLFTSLGNQDAKPPESTDH